MKWLLCFYTNLSNKGYFDLSGSGPQPGYGLSNTGPFLNLQSSKYWSGTKHSTNPYSTFAFYFDMGYQIGKNIGENSPFYAWAVRDGDVGMPITLQDTIET
ncbi:hypothetical protein ACFL9U_03295 [Thermodesulfobacteriota bacterium]